MNKKAFKLRMQNLKSYRGGNPDKGYWDWRNSLPSNLRNTDDSLYDMRAAYESGAQPLYYEDDLSYHLPTRDPKTGRILKSPTHPTYLIGLIEDAKEGYYPYIKDGKTHTDTWEGNEPPIRQYVDGGEAGEVKTDAVLNYKQDYYENIPRTFLNGRKWLDLDRYEQLNIKLGRTEDGRPLEKGLEIVSPEFDIITGIRGLTNGIIKGLGKPVNDIPTKYSTHLDKTIGLPNNSQYTKNRIFEGKSMFGPKSTEIQTNVGLTYRSTRRNQLLDILETGYVRPKSGKLKGGHYGESFWSTGNPQFTTKGEVVLETKPNIFGNVDINRSVHVSDLLRIYLDGVNILDGKIHGYEYGGETPIKGYWNKRNPGLYVAPVAYDYSGEAEYRSTLPEVEVRANKVIPKTTSLRMSEAMTDTDKKIMRGAWDLALWTPLGDPLMMADIYTDVKDQSYGSLAATVGLLAAPSFLRKPIKAVGRLINKGIKWGNTGVDPMPGG